MLQETHVTRNTLQTRVFEKHLKMYLMPLFFHDKCKPRDTSFLITNKYDKANYIVDTIVFVASEKKEEPLTRDKDRALAYMNQHLPFELKIKNYNMVFQLTATNEHIYKACTLIDKKTGAHVSTISLATEHPSETALILEPVEGVQLPGYLFWIIFKPKNCTYDMSTDEECVIS